MATQIIRCPADLLQDLWAGYASQPASPRRRFVTLEPLSKERRCHAIMVAVSDLRLTWDDWPWCGDQVLVLFLTSDPRLDDPFAPRPLLQRRGPFSTGHVQPHRRAIQRLAHGITRQQLARQARRGFVGRRRVRDLLDEADCDGVDPLTFRA
jgi:hypothetical protein